MPKYRVKIGRTVTIFDEVTIEVEAENPNEAWSKAISKPYNEPDQLVWTANPPDEPDYDVVWEEIEEIA